MLLTKNAYFDWTLETRFLNKQSAVQARLSEASIIRCLDYPKFDNL